MNELKENSVCTTENSQTVIYKKYTVFKVLAIVFYALTLIFLIYGAIDVAVIPAEESSRGIALAAYLMFFVIILGCIGFAISIVFSFVGGILSLIGYKKGNVKCSTVIFFAISVFLPVITEVLFIVIAQHL